PRPIVDKLHADLKAIVANPDTQHRLVDLGVIPIDSPPVAELQAYIKTEIGRWGKVVEQAGIAGSQ
ncbi:MAG: tripartite tricarboxylate transporter substrate binding protein, partial [Bradyrhizobium sp.]